MALALVLPATSETCVERGLAKSGLNTARDVHSAIMAGDESPPISRAHLVKLRDREKSCAGINSFDYLLALMDVQYGNLQDGVDGMGIVLVTDAPDLEKNRMMSRLVTRFVQGGHIQTAIDLTAVAETSIPDSALSYRRERALLLAGKGRFDEARALIDADVEAALTDAEPDQIPYSVWVRLAIAEVSGDAADERKLLDRLAEVLGPAAPNLVARDRISMDYQMLMGRQYDAAYSPDAVTPPTLRYPTPMRLARKSGSCDVRFDLTEEGVPNNLSAECNEDGFKEESLRAVAEVRFSELTIDGVPRRTFNLVYPLEFRIQ